MDLSGKKVLVCGMARSGISAAHLAKKHGALVTIQDIKEKDKMDDSVCQIEENGIEIYAGKNPDEIISGMDLVIVSPGIPINLPFFKIGKEAGVKIISEIEFSSYFTPCPIIAITGTNGKTTTTSLTGEIIKTEFPESVVVGNIGVPFSSQVEKLVRKSYVVAEISSFQMETTSSLHAHISAVLNITPDHLDRHKTLECYTEMKERVFKNSTKEDFLILNFSDVATKKMADKTEAQVFFFSSQEELTEGIFIRDNHIIVKWKDIDTEFIDTHELKILGVHNYENAMAAIAIGICANVPLDKIKETVKNFGGVEHRIEFVANVSGVDYYNDSKATNTDAAIRGIMAMNKPCILIGGGYDKGSDYDEWVEKFNGRVKHLVLIGATADKIEECCKKYNFNNITKAKSFKEALNICRGMSGEGDSVLLSPACASWGMFDNYEQRGNVFKEIVMSFK